MAVDSITLQKCFTDHGRPGRHNTSCTLCQPSWCWHCDSFIAYLVGVLSRSFNPPLVRLGTFSHYFPRRFKPKIGFVDFWRQTFIVSVPTEYPIGFRSELDADEMTALIGARLSTTGLSRIRSIARRAGEEGMINEDKTQNYYKYLVRQVPNLGNALVGREPELYSVYDRMISEYEFRIGIGAPLIALAITLTIRWSLLWLLILLPILVLLGTGSQQRMAAGDLLADAVRLHRIDVALPRQFSPDSTQPPIDRGDHDDG